MAGVIRLCMIVMSLVLVWCATNCRSSSLHEQININNNCTCACGTIQNIKYPFRLAGDPTSCGLPHYQLSCLNNRTILHLNNNKSFLVLSIDYDRFTIRLLDPGLDEKNHHNYNNSCSPFPRYTLTEDDVPEHYSYSIYSAPFYSIANINAPVIFIGCTNPAKSPLYVKMMDAGFCSNNNYSYSYYVLDGYGVEGIIENSCSITAVAWYSLSRASEEEEIGEALGWGFELFWFRFNCSIGIDGCYYDCSIGIDHSGAFITCTNYIYNHRTPCDLLHWPHHLDFNHNCK